MNESLNLVDILNDAPKGTTFSNDILSYMLNGKAMNNKINIVDILKNVPRGTKLWGECVLVRVITDMDVTYPIECETMNNHGELEDVVFTAYGSYTAQFAKCQCVLFPSEQNHDWSTFKVPKKPKEFKPFEKVLIKVFREGRLIWMAAFYSHYDKAACQHLLVGFTRNDDDDIIPYEGNEDMIGKKAE